MARVLAAGLVLACVVAAHTAAAAEPRLTHEQLVDRAFTICARASGGIARVRPALSFAASADAIARVLRHMRRAVARLDDLRVSTADTPGLQRYVSLMRQQVATLARAQRSAGRADRQAFRTALLEAGGISLRARAAAHQLGLSVCSTI
jgi:23S rRNA C2498 (ribose-2'-O)-methylase RlmM